ncbi:transcription factor FER-LIKE IRON DEFICIENCY-INDUCED TRANSCRIPTION FACTOR isoform X1 [Prunus yedoensis var. nudiflora]|uniref:Transcription factor FER-LIKE IRON DEFICIENCY-INDUCED TRANSCRIPTION FACTOR isoform X1 n=1 Tax=Prunus yedoensis var. nudiflora TaxID=2094558 RepID=A0A314Z4R6_PRUYE|nr:transcription factor FER-LIKE IRON DEFICIENCY-INDUCED TRANSCRIPTION FACTOR isoform X1 [Prunus yedoensis var. nudiflora]
MDAHGNHLRGHNINDFELQDLTDDANFDQFIDLIRGQNEDPVASFDCDLMINGCFDDYNLFCPASTTPGVVFSFNDAVASDPSASFLGTLSDPSAPLLTTLPNVDGEMKGGEEDHNGEDSSGTTTTTTTTTTNKRQKVDRSRTLVSERRRRGRMKERLYALRSLVPNITKMDKASIVGDAVLYVQDLQKQAKKLKAEIESLEASLAADDHEGYQDGSTENPSKNKFTNNSNLVSKGIIQIDVSQVEEKGFYVKVACNKGGGVAAALYKALESFTSFNVQSSNLNTVSTDRFELTLALNVKECEHDIINLPNLKLWVTGAFLNQGFELASGFSAQ